MSDPLHEVPDGIADFASDVDDTEFGPLEPLEMFDSNLMARSIPWQAVPSASSDHASNVLTPEEAMPPPSKKHKRSKNASKPAVDSSLPSTDGRSKKKHKKSKKDKRPNLRQVPDGQTEPVSDDSQTTLAIPAAADNLTLLANALPELNVVESQADLPPAKSKKKRKLSDSANGKKRKKRRSHGHDDQEQHGAEIQAAADDLLRKDKDAGITSASAIDDNVEDSDPQKSPTVAHFRRRSQSREAMSRQSSVLLADPDRMEIDPLAGQVAAAAMAANDGLQIDDAEAGAPTEVSAGADDFLRKDNDAGSPTASAIDDNVEGSDPQKSPTVAHLRRRSQSREALSRQNSISPADPDHMEIDPLAGQIAAAAAATAANDGEPVDADVEALAREAWKEHRNGQSSAVDAQGANEAVVQPHLPESSEPMSSRRRSTRKKAKPTFFEQPLAEVSNDEANEVHHNALAELPSPPAMTPKPRDRSKTDARKTKKGRTPKMEREKKGLSQVMDGRVDEQGAGEGHREDESRRARRDRLGGFTTGRFSDDELAKIARAVESFRVEQNLTQAQVNQKIQVPGGTTAGEDCAQLWAQIFAQCPDRHRQKVINITRKKFHNFVARGTWTLEQDAELSALIGVHGTKWSKIAGLINRHPEDLRDRYRNYLVCGPNLRKEAWTEAEVERLTKLVLEAMATIDEMRKTVSGNAKRPNPSLFSMSYEELIDWQNISEKMLRTRSRLQCITKWKSLNLRMHGKDKLNSSEPDTQISFRLEKARRQIAAMPEEEKFRLVLAIQATEVEQDAKIPWQRLVDKQFRNQWHRPTQVLLWRRLRQALPGSESKTTCDCALELVEQYKQSGELPQVNGDGYDVMQEMEYVKRIPVASTGANSGSGASESKSEELIADSDMEGADGAAAGADVCNAAEAPEGDDDNDDLKIDPALVETPAPAKKATTARRTGTGKPPSRNRSNKAPTANMDPIEDDDASRQRPANGQDSGSEVDGPPSRPKKTPRRFKSPKKNRNDQAASPRSAGFESALDDMEDLPARLPT